ncbi:hypothetical protein RND81_09G135800 [Saponaria officinalis]|uniref:SCP domain-containing protein n=1 Tax=Saponaria officinalis TaxID=3572 RepID=A0AAW1IMB9_SAPOF
MTLIYVQISHAQNSPQDYVYAHNIARSAVGVGPIEWDDQVAAYAAQYASQRAGDCALQNSPGPYGENLAVGSGEFMTGVAAVKLWVGEQTNYNYDTNTCDKGQQCREYTQVVWRDSVRLGCARVQCGYNGSYFVTCNYYPPGNYFGEKPY